MENQCKIYRLPPKHGTVWHLITVVEDVISNARIYIDGSREVIVVTEASDMVICIQELILKCPGLTFCVYKRMFWERPFKGVVYGKPDLRIFGARKWVNKCQRSRRK